MTITLRDSKGSALTHAELDANFTHFTDAFTISGGVITASVTIDNGADTDFLNTIILGAGSSTLQKRYITFKNLDDSAAMYIGANASNSLIAFSVNDSRHYIIGTEDALGGELLLNSGATGVVTVNREENASNAGFAVYSGGAGTPDRWVHLDGQGIRIFVGGLSFAALGGSADTTILRDAADVLGIRNTTAEATPQELRLYGRYTSATVYERSSWKMAKATLSSVSGASVTESNLIPQGAFLLGVTTRVQTALGTGNGTTGYTVGDGTDADRFGTVTGTSTGTSTDNSVATADATGFFTAANDVVVTATGGNFDGTGDIEVIAHYITTEAD